MKKKKLFKVFAIIACALVILATPAVLGVRYFMIPIGKYPDKSQFTKYEELSSQFYDEKFHNESEPENTGFAPSTGGKRVMPSKELPVEKITSLDRAASDKLTVTWLGHSSSLIQLGEQNILLDPILVNQQNAMQYRGLPERYSDFPLDVKNMPDIDVLCISHDHYDHLDYSTIMAVDSKVKNYIVPLGVDSILKGWGISEDKIKVLSWWQNIEIGGITYTLTPAQHYSGRFANKQYKTLWGGIYMQNSSHSVYFTGDSGYCGTFREIYERFGETDIILADSGEDAPAWSHMSPDEVYQAADEVHAEYLLPVHWGAYLYGSTAWYQPIDDIAEKADSSKVSLMTPKLGQTIEYNDFSTANEHWWEEYK
jgi:Predicted Zn-dependent hydrolases of the beta-lactamase fold